MNPEGPKTFSSNLFIVLFLLFFSISLPAHIDSLSFPFIQIPSLLPDFDDSYGVAFRDIDGDGWPDLYVVGFRSLNRFFINQGSNIPFLDYTIQSGLGGNLMPYGRQNLELGVAAVDMNNDGLVDITIAGWGVTTQLFLQQKNHRFRNITHEAGLSLPLDGNGAFWADVNNDNYLDLFITDEHYMNRLWLGDGRGNFVEVSKQWGLDDKSTSQSAAFGDLDGDGYSDLYVCNWFAPDILYRNLAGKSFQRIYLPLRHLCDSLSSNGISLGDIDNDGDLDLLVTDRDGCSALYRNDCVPTDTLWYFTEITLPSGLQLPYPSYGSVIADFNNDGYLDIWVSAIGPNRLYMNRGNATFQKVFEEVCPPQSHLKYYSTGAACADYDLDGDLDLFVSNKDTNSILYINTSNDSNYLQIELTGTRSNRDAIGSKIWLFKNDTTLLGYRQISGGGGYLSQSSLVVHFGIREEDPLQAVIQFPGGIVKKLTHLRRGHRYRVEEISPPLKSWYLGYHYFYRLSKNREFWLSLIFYWVLIGILIWFVLFSTRRYHWAAHHIIVFFTLTLMLLYGIFIALQENPLHLRLIFQILSLIAIFLLLTFFMEKIRKLELKKNKYRHLLQHFSRQLILIKDNNELFEKLVQTLQQSLQPEFCVVYSIENGQLRKLVESGAMTDAVHSQLCGNIQQQLKSQNLDKQSPLHSYWEFARSYFFPLFYHQQVFAVLVVGKPAFFPKFSTEDLEIFTTLTAQASVAYENNQYIEEAKRLTRQITESRLREEYLSELEKAYQKLKANNKKLQKLFRDLQNTQAQLIQSEKMASLGQLVAGVAHELNNPISYIYANMKELENYTAAISELLTLLRRDLTSPPEKNMVYNKLLELKSKYDFDFIHQDIRTLIQESLEGSIRVKNVVQNLRNFSRLDEAALKWVDLHEGLESTLLLLNNELKNRIEVHKEYHPLPPVYCHPGNMNQVFMNVLLNAIQAIEDRGNIWIKTEQKGEQVEISIRDDGRGIPARFQNKVFDPFFTTKPVGKGTGLGLSISYNIIKEHQGQIAFTSQEGKGTTFFIKLPISPRSKNLPHKKPSRHGQKSDTAQ